MSEDAGDKWDKVAATARARGKSSGSQGDAGKGGETGARGSKKGEAQQLRGITAKRAKEARQYLETVSPSQLGYMLTGSSKTLTAKQRAFAYHVAQGATKADAYRTAYKKDATKATIISQPYALSRDPRIALEIEAYKLAAEAAKHRTAEDLRSLVIQTLVQQVIDPDCPPAVRTQAAKTLGNVTEVAAFTERKESVVHHTSDKIRAQILEQVSALMAGKTVEGERIEQDAASLLAELSEQSSTQDCTQESPDFDGPSLDAQDTSDSQDDNSASP